MTAREVMRKVESDSHFYRRSGGGLTLSGGEAASQPAFSMALLAEAKRMRLDSAMETAGFYPWETLALLAGGLARVIYDLKHWDEERHLKYTGAGLGLILENLRRLASEFPALALTVRTPVIPGFNDSDDDLAAIRRLIPEGPNVGWELMPYHRMGESKYAFLGRPRPWEGEAPEPESFEALKARMAISPTGGGRKA
jgi:pyruvate formate lyase activating enzyme